MSDETSIMHLKGWCRTYSTPCGCMLDRRRVRRRSVVDFYPCARHAALRWRLETREDGSASVFAEDRSAWIARSIRATA